MGTPQEDIKEQIEIFESIEEDVRYVRGLVERLVADFGYTQLDALLEELTSFLVDVSDGSYTHPLELQLEELEGEEFDDVMDTAAGRPASAAPAGAVPTRSAPMRGGRM